MDAEGRHLEPFSYLVESRSESGLEGKILVSPRSRGLYRRDEVMDETVPEVYEKLQQFEE
jgi:hypothetical protein